MTWLNAKAEKSLVGFCFIRVIDNRIFLSHDSIPVAISIS